ncbi:fam171b [Pungitius sinensis]
MPAAERSPPPRPLLLLLPSLLLIWCLDGAVGAAAAAAAAEEGGGGLPSSSSSSSAGDNGLAVGDPPATEATGPGRFVSPSAAMEEPRFALKVLVKDQVTRQPLPGASVDVYVNHTLRSSSRTGRSGGVLLWVAYSPGLSLTLLGSMGGYVPRPLPWSTARRPVFSAVTLLLLPHSQGDVWLFDDAVLITGKFPDRSSQPTVQFPKDLLALSDEGNVSTVTAYLTVPQHHLDCANCTPGIIGKPSPVRSIELKAVAAVSVLLCSGGGELQVRGPIQISLPLRHSPHLRALDTVPAWAFNPQTGAWENQGLGIVRPVGEELVWTYTASHLGYWIAAPLPSSNGRGFSIDFLSYHTYLLMGILGATLAVAIGFLSLLLCHCRRSSHRQPRGRRGRFSKLSVVKKDQTTSTHMEEGLLFRSGDNSLASCSVPCEPSSTPRHKAAYNIYVEDPGGRPAAPLYENVALDRLKGSQPPSHYVNGEEVARLTGRANVNSDSFFQEKMVHIYSQPVAVLQAPELFAAQELSGCKSATFPRDGVEYDAHPEHANKDGYAKTLVPHHHSQGGGSQDEPQPLETPPQGQGPSGVLWGGRYNNLLESSVSVPGTLNEAAGAPGRGRSHPRAWFVSLDGKPAAQVRHSVIELQTRRRAPGSSNDTSLDSGVDMNEPPQGVREVERDRRAPRASTLPHRGRGGARHGDDQDLSSSESGTTATCTPEDPSLRSILDGSSGAIPNIPEERDGMDTSSAQEDSESRETPPPRRLRKVREKGKADRRSARQVREGRPVAKRS